MALERIGPLTDDERAVTAIVDRELARLLSVEPSADFLPRVRAAVQAAAPRRGAYRPGAWGLAAAAAIAVVIAGTLLVRSRHEPALTSVATVSTPTPPIAARQTDRVAPDNDPNRLSASPRQVRVASRHRTPTSAPQPSATEPDVLVSSERKVALDRFLRLARAGSLDRDMFRSREPEGTADGDDAAVAPIALETLEPPPPVKVEDITGGSREIN